MNKMSLISVDDRLPKDMSDVLCFSETGNPWIICSFESDGKGGGDFYANGTGKSFSAPTFRSGYEHITHWMKLVMPS